MSDRPTPRLETVDEEHWAERAADLTVAELRSAIRQRGRATLGLSGGSTPAPYFAALAERSLDWGQVTIVQMDEREAPAGSPDRNLTAQKAALGALPARWLDLPVHAPQDPVTLKAWVVKLREVAGNPPLLDVIHLGLGTDGHTASLIPGDPVLKETHHVIARTALYKGAHRLTVTAPTLSRAGLVLWLVKGEDKLDPIERLMEREPSIPASLVTAHRQVIVHAC